MQVSIGRSSIHGQVVAPSSKSYTIRGLMCAALANGKSQLVNPLLADDTEAASGVLRGLGVNIERSADSWLVSGGRFEMPESSLDCRESAATLRFMTAMGAKVPGGCQLTAKPSLARRPIQPLIQALRQVGVDCDQNTETGTVSVNGSRFRGGVSLIPGNISSQYVSALLLISPLAERGMRVRLTSALESKPYVEMTIECLSQFGISVEASADYCEFMTEPQQYRPAKYSVEGDWSSVSFLLALGAVAGSIEIVNVNPRSLQGDKILLEYVERMGATISVAENSARVERSGGLKAVNIDMTDCIDLLPTVAVLAAFAKGTTELTGIARARLKESDRVLSVKNELQRAGIEVREDRDRLCVVGGNPVGGLFQSHGDHRIAMAMSILGVVVGNTTVDGAECVAKTYPEYWSILSSIGGKVDISG